MALEAGVIVLTLEYADGLKDVQWFGRQDPYCRVIIGNQEFKSRTANSGGKTPVWNETFRCDEQSCQLSLLGRLRDNKNVLFSGSTSSMRIISQ